MAIQYHSIMVNFMEATVEVHIGYYVVELLVEAGKAVLTLNQ